MMDTDWTVLLAVLSTTGDGEGLSGVILFLEMMAVEEELNNIMMDFRVARVVVYSSFCSCYL